MMSLLAYCDKCHVKTNYAIHYNYTDNKVMLLINIVFMFCSEQSIYLIDTIL